MTITRDGHARASHLRVRHMHMNVREIDVDTHHRYHRVIILVSMCHSRFNLTFYEQNEKQYLPFYLHEHEAKVVLNRSLTDRIAHFNYQHLFNY